jgi:hypothetical protein
MGVGITAALQHRFRNQQGRDGRDSRCGGGTVTGLANSIGWLRWLHGKRQLLRLAVHLVLSSARDNPELEDVLGRADEIVFRYGDRRLLRELMELREKWVETAPVPADTASEDLALRLSRLDELISQISDRL